MRQRPDPLPRGVLPVRQRTTPRRWSGPTSSGGCARRYSHLDPDTVFEEARREEVCPFEVQLELAQRADAIVADYNYVFEPAAALRHLSGEDLRDAILLVDEAHNLPDRARQIFSPAILGGGRSRSCATGSRFSPASSSQDI